MTKTELTATLADALNIPKAQAGRALDALGETLAAAIRSGQAVTLPGVGSFQAVDRAARKGRNPSTGAPIDIPARRAVAFKASGELRKAL